MVHKLCLDEEWWSKIDFFLKFTSPTFELLQNANTDKPFLREVYNDMDTLVEKTTEIILQESQRLFVDLMKKIIVERCN
jgi:hypothetical protein